MKTYNIITIGCQMNKSDSERVAGYLEKHEYKWTDNRNQADLVVINTCGVRQSAEDRVYGLIPRIKKENPRAIIVLAGCLSERVDVKAELKDKVDVWLPIVELPNLINLINHCKKNSKPSNGASKDLYGYLKIRPKHQSKVSAFVPIGNGCNNFCAYCVVPYARGREVYRSAKEILDEVKDLVNNGYKEIILIAQNVNSYLFKSVLINARNESIDLNRFKQINFAKLLKLINNIRGSFWVRFATSHPKDMSDELIKAVNKLEKVCEHIHLPAQSGDNRVLQLMNRNYTVEDYKKLVKKIRRIIPGVSISTDIIVGFPGETRKQFANSVKLFKEIKFDMAYIAQYSPRPNTAAAKLEDDVPREEKKKREEELTKVLRKTALENNQKYIGKVVDVLIEGRNKEGEWRGKTKTGKNVKIKTADDKHQTADDKHQTVDLIGGFVKVKITKARDFGLEGEIR